MHAAPGRKLLDSSVNFHFLLPLPKSHQRVSSVSAFDDRFRKRVKLVFFFGPHRIGRSRLRPSPSPSDRSLGCVLVEPPARTRHVSSLPVGRSSRIVRFPFDCSGKGNHLHFSLACIVAVALVVVVVTARRSRNRRSNSSSSSHSKQSSFELRVVR